MKTIASLAFIALGCACTLSSCFEPNVRSSITQLDVRPDTKSDELRIAITLFDLSADEPALERAQKDIQHVLSTDRTVILDWFLDLDEMIAFAADRSKKQGVTADDRLLLTCSRSTSILQTLGYFDERGRPALTQLLAIHEWSKVLKLWNAAVDEKMLAVIRKGELAPQIGENSVGLILARASRGGTWLTLDAEGLHVEFPLTVDGFDTMSKSVREEDGLTQVTIPILEMQVPLEALSYSNGSCRVTIGTREGNHFRFNPAEQSTHPYDKRLARWLEKSGTFPHTRERHEQALKLVETLEPVH